MNPPREKPFACNRCNSEMASSLDGVDETLDSRCVGSRRAGARTHTKIERSRCRDVSCFIRVSCCRKLNRAQAVRPLAQQHVVVDESLGPASTYCYATRIARWKAEDGWQRWD